jgi:tRNA (guanine37-N1)-methyltransferase
MVFYVLTLFPEMVLQPLKFSVLGKAMENGVFRVEAINIRDFAFDRHKTTDDYPYGGGQGMIMKPEPVTRAIKFLLEQDPKIWFILLTPQGITFSQSSARRLSKFKKLALVCGRYEGIDERVKRYVNEEISIGDYVLTGGEFAALVIIDCVVRLLPSALHRAESAQEESFSEDLLEYPQYTRPPFFEGKKVPEVLLSGNHREIEKWRRREALFRTWVRRPDLLKRARLREEDRRYLLALENGS